MTCGGGHSASIADKTSTAVAYRGRVLDRAARFGVGGFPEQVTTPSVPGRRVTAVAAVAAAAAALALLGGAMYYAAQASGHDPAPSAVSRRPPLTGPTGTNGSTRAPAGGPSAGARGPAPAPGVDPAMHRLGASGRSPVLGLLGVASTGPPALRPASAGAPSAARSPSSAKSPKPSSAPPSSAPPSSAPPSSAPPSSAPPSSAPPSSAPPSSAPPSSACRRPCRVSLPSVSVSVRRRRPLCPRPPRPGGPRTNRTARVAHGSTS